MEYYVNTFNISTGAILPLLTFLYQRRVTLCSMKESSPWRYREDILPLLHPPVAGQRRHLHNHGTKPVFLSQRFLFPLWLCRIATTIYTAISNTTCRLFDAEVTVATDEIEGMCLR